MTRTRPGPAGARGGRASGLTTRCGAWLLLGGLLCGQALAAPSGPRLASIKQHALALHTVSLSDPQRFSRDAIAVLDYRHPELRPTRLRLWLNDTLWFDYHYGSDQARRLQAGGAQFLGLAPLAAGSHALRVELQVRDTRRNDAPAYSLSQQARLTLPKWPRGIVLRLGRRRDGGADLELQARVDGPALLRAAEHALERGLPGRALSILQTLGQVDPGLAQDPRHTLLTGRSLRDWGLDNAAESMFAQLIGRDIARDSEAAARLQAAELALSLQRLPAARRYLDWPQHQWPDTQRDKAQVLLNRLLLAEGRVEEAGTQIPDRAPLLWQYNLALALLQAGQDRAGERLLRGIGDTAADDRQSAAVRDLANLKLGYWLLGQRRPDDAGQRLAQVPADSAEHARALLGRGWSALAALAPDAPAGHAADDLRPAFIRRIDAAVRGASGSDREKALLRAIESWTQLRDGDPLDPSVQEALVAIPYALAQLGADARAIGYAELAVARLDAARLGLSRIYTQSIKRDTLNAAQLAASAWPPQPLAWREHVHDTAWWRDAAPEAPPNAHLRQLLAEDQTLEILHHMSVLSEAQAMVEAAAGSPNLEARAQQLLRRIDAERGVQQKAFNRFVWTWLDRRGTLTTRYLILARLILGQVAGRQDAR